MVLDIPVGLGSVKMSDAAHDINALAYGGIGLELELVPKFGLPGKDEGHRTL
jgi:hypothetical protein